MTKDETAPGHDPWMSGPRVHCEQSTKMAWSPAWLGKQPDMYTPKLWRPAQDIKVAQFRQIYIWPLALRLSERDNTSMRIAEYLTEVGENLLNYKLANQLVWKEEKDLLNHLISPPTNSSGDRPTSLQMKMETNNRYSEFVYFHDYLQSILFRKPPDSGESPSFRLFRREDVKRADIAIDNELFSPGVDRCNLYLFRTGAAILVAELSFRANEVADARTKKNVSSALNLKQVQALTDRVRRSYTPYFWTDTEENSETFGKSFPGAMPSSFVWKIANGETIGKDASTPPSVDMEWEHIRDQRIAPMARHWRDILAPLTVAGYEGQDAHGPVWRHVVDERIPVMSFVSLSGAAQGCGIPVTLAFPDQDTGEVAQMHDLQIVSRGDWMRLCFADAPGSDSLPYSPYFLHKFEAQHCYDRFFPSNATDSASRYMFAGYHMVVVGAGEYFDNTLLHHFRRHYFQMGLVINMEFASMLATSSRISAAVHELIKNRISHTGTEDGKLKADQVFRNRLVDIERGVQELSHQLQFSGLSNQVQATEMYALWRRTLRIDDMLQDLKSELNSAMEFLQSTEQVQQTIAANREAAAATQQVAAANQLAIIAVIGVVLGLTFSALGMNIIFDDEAFKSFFKSETATVSGIVSQLLPVGFIMFVFGLIGYFVAKRILLEQQDKLAQRMRLTLRWICGVGGSLFLIGAVAMAWQALR